MSRDFFNDFFVLPFAISRSIGSKKLPLSDAASMYSTSQQPVVTS